MTEITIHIEKKRKSRSEKTLLIICLILFLIFIVFAGISYWFYLKVKTSLIAFSKIAKNPKTQILGVNNTPNQGKTVPYMPGSREIIKISRSDQAIEIEYQIEKTPQEIFDFYKKLLGKNNWVAKEISENEMTFFDKTEEITIKVVSRSPTITTYRIIDYHIK